MAPGTGLIAKTAVLAGADVIFALSAGVYRTAGAGSLASFLAYGNANDQIEGLLGTQILYHAGETPVVAGLMPGEPERTVGERLDRLGEMGVEGVTNWPATGLADGLMKRIMADEGIAHETECAMLGEAKYRGFAVFGFALTAPAAGGSAVRSPSKTLLARAAVDRCRYNKSRAALELGISRKTLYRRLQSG